MHLVNCESPKYVFSRQRNEFVRVACGKCDTCRMSKAADWVSRIEMEDVCNKFCFMVTLTYDDQHLPAYFFADDMDNLVCNRDNECIPLVSLLNYIYSNKDQKVVDKELTYLKDRLTHPLGLPVIYKKDISDFFKRLNKYCFDHVTKSFENFRYFCCSEYGPSTFRPHYHMLVWFSKSAIASRFSEILSASWSFGRSDASAVFSNGGKSYVAQYVNMSSHLPSFYSFGKIRPGHQESKQPPIGSDALLDSKVREIYDSGTIKRIVYNSKISGYSAVPFTKSFKDRFYPKLQGFDNIPDQYRNLLYGVYCRLSKEKRTLQEFISYVSAAFYDLSGCSSTDDKIISWYYNYLYENSVSSESFENNLKRWFYVSKRICYYAWLCSFSVSKIVSLIVEFHKKVDYDCLLQFYQFQENYVSSHPFADLVILYPGFYKDAHFYLSHPSEIKPFYIEAALNMFDLYTIEDLPKVSDTYDYKSMKDISSKIFKDTHKRHAINAYIDGQLKDSDFSLYNIIKNFNS